MSKILIIEDDADLVHLMSHALYSVGYEVHYAFNGKEGFEKILSLMPDLILLDLKMPVLSGADVLKKISDNTSLRDLPVIVMTAHAGPDNLLERSIMAQGAREFVKKPFNIKKEILPAIRRHLSAKAAQKAEALKSVAKGAVRLDLHLRTVWINDKHVATLPPKRAKVLRMLLEAKGSLRRDKLIYGVWGEKGSDNLLEKTVQRLRQDLGPAESARIQTQPGGYELIG